MGKLEDLKKMIADDFEKCQDVERSKFLGQLVKTVEDVETEQKGLLQNYQELKDEYLKVVKTSINTTKAPNDHSGKNKSVADIARDLGLDKKIKF